MIVYLVRHGDAVSEEKDPSRPLSKVGEAEVLATAEGLKAEGVKVDEIWHSVKLRAKQTAEIVARVLNVSIVIEKQDLKPNDPVAPIAELLKSSKKTILIAGHMPFLGKLVALIRGGEEVGFPSGGVERVNL